MPHVPTQCARAARQHMHVHAHGPSQVRCRGLLTHAAHIARALSGELTARGSAGPEIAQAEEAEQLLRGPGNNRLAAAACTPPGACPAASCAAASQCACMAPVPLWPTAPSSLTVSCQARAVLPAPPPIHPPHPSHPPAHARQPAAGGPAAAARAVPPPRLCGRPAGAGVCRPGRPGPPAAGGWRRGVPKCAWPPVLCMFVGWWGWGVPGGGGHMAVLAD